MSRNDETDVSSQHTNRASRLSAETTPSIATANNSIVATNRPRPAPGDLYDAE